MHERQQFWLYSTTKLFQNFLMIVSGKADQVTHIMKDYQVLIL